MSVKVLAPAKLTLSLRMAGLRSDGYHLIDAEMVTLDFADRITISPGSGLTITSGENVGHTADNLITKALRLVGREAHIAVEKHIPAGGGLGGGSADAAAILRWAGFADLAAAASIGADIAFCLVGGRARVRGIGEIVEPLPFLDKTLTLFTPVVRCPTAAVYRRWDELGGPVGALANDLEPAAIDLVPALLDAKHRLEDATGQPAHLAGSGSTWFVEGAYGGDGRRVVKTTPAYDVTIA